jgi:hypothetical protein
LPGAQGIVAEFATAAQPACLIACLRAPAVDMNITPALRDGALARAQHAWQREGIPLAKAQFDALALAGRTLLVPHADEPRILQDGVDPLKTF